VDNSSPFYAGLFPWQVIPIMRPEIPTEKQIASRKLPGAMNEQPFNANGSHCD